MKYFYDAHVKFYKTLKDKYNLEESQENEKMFTQSNIEMSKTLNELFKKTEIVELSIAIKKLIKKYGGVVFIKTSSRSPKDVVMNSKTYFSKELMSQIKKLSPDLSGLERKFAVSLLLDFHFSNQSQNKYFFFFFSYLILPRFTS